MLQPLSTGSAKSWRAGAELLRRHAAGGRGASTTLGDHGGSDASLDHRKRAVPASASLSIAAVADQVGGVELPDPVALAPGLRSALAQVVDPRQRRGVRHPLVVVLTGLPQFVGKSGRTR